MLGPLGGIMRVAILGNSGAGKSVLARRLAAGRVPVLELDRLAWEPGQVARDAATAHGDLQAFLDRHPEWVVEGRHAELVGAALARGAELLFLDPGMAACLRHCRARPWESARYASRAEQDLHLPSALAWAEAYERRTDGCSRPAHEALFAAHSGPKRRLLRADQVAPGYPMAGGGAEVAETERLRLRFATLADAPWFLRLLNEPSWIEHIGDREVRTLAQAEAYLQARILKSYATHGHGLNRVELKASGEPIGLCGLIRRDGWEDRDLGYALLPEFEGQGFATEAGAATLAHGERAFTMRGCLAFVSPGNHGSVRVLEKLGFRGAGTTDLAPGDTVLLFRREGPANPAAAPPASGPSAVGDRPALG